MPSSATLVDVLDNATLTRRLRALEEHCSTRFQSVDSSQATLAQTLIALTEAVQQQTIHVARLRQDHVNYSTTVSNSILRVYHQQREIAAAITSVCAVELERSGQYSDEGIRDLREAKFKMETMVFEPVPASDIESAQAQGKWSTTKVAFIAAFFFVCGISVALGLVLFLKPLSSVSLTEQVSDLPLVCLRESRQKVLETTVRRLILGE